MPADHQRTTLIFHQRRQQAHTEQSHTQAVSGGWPVHMQLLSSKVMASHRARQQESHSLEPRKQTTVSHHHIYEEFNSVWLKISTAAKMHCSNYLRTPRRDSEKLLVTTWIAGMNDKWNFSLMFIGILTELCCKGDNVKMYLQVLLIEIHGSLECLQGKLFIVQRSISFICQGQKRINAVTLN